METLIVSKTKWGSQFCVGGLLLDNNQSIRLQQQNGDFQPAETPFEIGSVWDIDFVRPDIIIEPHNEDVLVINSRFLRNQNNLSRYLMGREIRLWRGSPTILYYQTLHFTTTDKGYVPENGLLPNTSVGFWIPDSRLRLIEENEKPRYIYYNNNIRCNIPYKGCANPVEVIQAGELVRVSLARLLRSELTPHGFYLQLSGWYFNIE